MDDLITQAEQHYRVGEVVRLNLSIIGKLAYSHLYGEKGIISLIMYDHDHLMIQVMLSDGSYIWRYINDCELL